MTNVEKNNSQIDRERSRASTTTSSYYNNEFCLVSFLNENTWINDSRCSLYIIGGTVTFGSDQEKIKL
jgi:hypothetical protein